MTATGRLPGARRHSWEKLAEHRYLCKREDCGTLAEKQPDPRGPGFSTRWTLLDGRVFDTRHGDRPPVCEPVTAAVVARARPQKCQLCAATDVRPYACGRRCNDHAPWAAAMGGDGIPPELHGQYCALPLHRNQAPDSATWGVVDARAIASGKRRSDPAALATARANTGQ